MAELLAHTAHLPPAVQAQVILRFRIERAIALLVDALDAMDGDPDVTDQAEDNDPLDYGEMDDAELSGIGDLDGLSEQIPWSEGCFV